MLPIIIFTIGTIGSLIMCIRTTWGDGYTDNYYPKWGIPILFFILLLLAILTI